MNRVTFYIDTAKGAGGTEILAGAAAYAARLVDGGHQGRFVVVLVERHHGDGSHGTDFGTMAATVAVGQRDAVFLDPDGMPNLYGRLLGTTDGLDGTGGADFRATGAFGSAIAFFIG